ncbi:MAG: hypothetical protein LBV23_05685 [Deltaproteobacteria bacterium]|jgi:hypothetical protein|nr:hypothetical protein [Deltaproteobacteria bacterium]
MPQNIDDDKTLNQEDDKIIIASEQTIDGVPFGNGAFEDSSPELSNQTAKSQAVKDLENHHSQPALTEPIEPTINAKKRPEPEKSASKPSWPCQWFLVFLLSLLGLAGWTVGCFINKAPYRTEALAIMGLAIIFTILAYKAFRFSTRAGLAAFFAAAGLSFSALYQSDGWFWPGIIPMAAIWVALLSLVWLWLIIAIWRNRDLRKNRVPLVLSALLLYPLISIVTTVLKILIFESLGLKSLTMTLLNESPTFLTETLPWFLWPQAFLAFLIPPLAAVFLLRDHMLINKNTKSERHHYGALWLALAGFTILIFSFLTFGPAAADFSTKAGRLYHLWPQAAQYRAQQTTTEKTIILAQKHRAHKAAAPSAQSQKEPETASLPSLAALTQDSSPLTEETVIDTSKSVAIDSSPSEGIVPKELEETVIDTSKSVAIDSSPSEGIVPKESIESTNSNELASSPSASSAPIESSPSVSSPIASENSADTAISEAAAQELAGIALKASSLEVGPGAPPAIETSAVPTLLIHQGPEEESKREKEELLYQIDTLTKENAALKFRLTVLETQNELLKDRLSHSDQLLLNLTNQPR